MGLTVATATATATKKDRTTYFCSAVGNMSSGMYICILYTHCSYLRRLNSGNKCIHISRPINKIRALIDWWNLEFNKSIRIQNMFVPAEIRWNHKLLYTAVRCSQFTCNTMMMTWLRANFELNKQSLQWHTWNGETNSTAIVYSRVSATHYD